MSMRQYPVQDMGLIVKIEELNVPALLSLLGVNSNDNEDPLQTVIDGLTEDNQFPIGNDWEDGVICHKSTYGNDFEGDVLPLLGDAHSIDIDVTNEEWVLMALPRYPSLFKAAYRDKNELISVMKTLYGKYIAEDFDFASRIVRVMGTVWG